MDDQKLKQLNELSSKIANKKQMIEATQNQNAEAIIFADDTGSKVVCDDLSEIENIRAMLIASHESRLKQLEDIFKEL